MTIEDMQTLALEHGLRISEEMSVNEMGIDFRVAFVKEVNGENWVPVYLEEAICLNKSKMKVEYWI